MRSPVPNLWLCGQDVLMCGQVLAAAAGTICALRMLGPLAWARFAVRALRLLAPAAVLGATKGAKAKAPDAQHARKAA